MLRMRFLTAGYFLFRLREHASLVQAFHSAYTKARR